MPQAGYTEAEKREALRCYLVQGTYQKAADASGIPLNTIRSWKHLEREWWDRVCNELITELEGEYRPGWVRVLGKAMEAMEDRLEGGDYVLTKEGLKRVPVKGKELGIILGIAADKLKSFGLMAPVKAAKAVAEERQERLVAIAQADRAQREGAVQ
jgi:hypothetical protein